MTAYEGRNAVAACPRCGRVRQLGAHNRSDLCRDCKYVEPNWPDVYPEAPVETRLGFVRKERDR